MRCHKIEKGSCECEGIVINAILLPEELKVDSYENGEILPHSGL
jgi:hypothetical protein